MDGKRFSKGMVGLTFVPYIVFSLTYTRTIISRAFMLYLYYQVFNPIYDYGQLLRFVYAGPEFVRRVMDLDEEKSFSKLQMKLFLRHCAKTELKKALDLTKKTEYKPFKELIMVRIFKNNIKNTINAWKRNFGKIQRKLSGYK